MCPNRTERQCLRPEWRCLLVERKRYGSALRWRWNLMQTLVTVTLGLLLLVSGSARAQGLVLPLPPQDQQNITAQLGPGVVGTALPSSPIGDPSVFFPLQEKSQKYQVMAGPNAGTVQTLGLWKTRRPGGRMAW